MRIRKLVTTIEFKCSNHMRIAKLHLSEMGMCEIFCVRLLIPGWADSNIILTDKMAKAFPEQFTISDDIINLRWFDGMSGDIKQDGSVELQVEITYTSKLLDRQEKLDVLGV